MSAAVLGGEPEAAPKTARLKQPHARSVKALQGLADMLGMPGRAKPSPLMRRIVPGLRAHRPAAVAERRRRPR
jgi:hypothetical protein